MTDFISFVILFILCFAPFALLGLLIYAITRKRVPSSINTDEEIISYLKKQKSDGYKTIDDLIEYLETKGKPKVITKSEEIKDEPKLVQKIESQPASKEAIKETSIRSNREISRSIQISSAEVLLYLGAFLITFAMLVLVTLGWEAISGIGKTLILILTDGAFLLAGVLLTYTTKLKKVGYTFLTVSSLGTPLVFLGIWNFLISGYFNLSFSLYWTIISILVVLMNIGFMAFTRKTRFYYLLQVSVYSLLISLAFTLTSDSNFRIVIIAILNVLFYFSNNIFGQYKKQTKIISTIMNMILNIFIILIVIAVNSGIQTDYQRFLAILALFVPTTLIVYRYIFDKSYIESGIELVFLPLKVLLLTSILRLNPDGFFVVFSVFIPLLVLLTEFEFSKRNKLLFWESIIVISGLLLLMNLGLTINWTSPNTVILSNLTVLFTLAISLFTVLFIPLKRKDYKFAGLGLTYLIFVLTRILNLYVTDLELRTVVYIYTLLTFGAVLKFIYFKSKNWLSMAQITQPFAEIIPVITLLLTLLTLNSTEISTIFLSISALYFIRALILNNYNIRNIAYLLFVPGYIALLHVFAKNNIFTFLNDFSDYSLPLTVVSILFFAINEVLRLLDKKFRAEQLASGIFLALAITLSLYTKEVLWINTLILFIYSAVIFALRLRKEVLVIIYAILQFLLGLGLNILKVDFRDALLIFSFINLGIGSITLLRYRRVESAKSYFNLLNNTNIIFVSLFTILICIAAFFEQSWTYTLIFFVIGVTYLTSHIRFIQKLAGILFIFSVWNMNSLAQLNFQFYVIPITVYGLVLAGIAYLEEKNQEGLALEVSSYSFQMFTMLAQSAIVFNAVEQIGVGLILIIFSIVLVIMGLFSSKKAIWITAIIFLFLELFLRLLFVIVLIPWWIYLGLIGLGLIGLASYIIYRTTSK